MDTVVDRQRVAVERTRRITALLAARGIRVRTLGCLAHRDFGAHPDAGFPMTAIPAALHYAIESQVEDGMRKIPSPILHLDEALPAAAAGSRGRGGGSRQNRERSRIDATH